jgi:hypothetical protein
MSLSKKGKRFPQFELQSAPSPFVRTMSRALAEELRRDGVTIKAVAHWAGVNERTVKNWISGRCGPSGDHLVRLVRYSDHLAVAFLGLADRPHASLLFQLREVRAVLCRTLLAVDHFLDADEGIALPPARR